VRGSQPRWACPPAKWSGRFATSVGIAALLVASEPAFAAVKLAGAAFLVYLGLKSLVAALRGQAPDPFEARERQLEPFSSYRQGR
jgi:threonine/homoserine/homoserine lactone efflux protein